MRNKILILFAFSIAFAFVEAMVVFYIRTLLGETWGYPADGYKTVLNLRLIAFIIPNDPILGNHHITFIESVREFATMVMLISIAYLAGSKGKQKLGAFLVSFGLWDIFYYVFLRWLINWPKSLSDIDIYFLIPVPWIGPVITPLVISFLLILIGIKLLFK